MYIGFLGLIWLAVGCTRQPQANPTVSPATMRGDVVPAASTTPPQRASTSTPVSESGHPTQYVVMAFDGSYSLEMWQKTLDFAQQMGAEDKPVHFTYFLSGVYFLNWRKADRYLPPLKPAGTSLIGFADSNRDVERRVAFANRAISEGHEIGSHANGHFDGSVWAEKDWQQEFSQFDNLIFNLSQNNDVDPPDRERYTINLSKKDLVGFRAPDLGKNAALYAVLQKNGYRYDTSGVGKAGDWPKQDGNGIWRFPVAQISYGTTTSPILAMDYNFYFKQSGATDTVKKGEQEWDRFLGQTYESYINYFNKNYSGNRAPVYIGSHFSEWNDGVYWEAMQKFARAVCGKPQVKCVSFKELMQALETRD